MGRRGGGGGGGGGNAWNDFQRAHGGQGLSRGEMSAMYHASAAPSVSTSHSHHPTHATRATLAWNEFQHEYGGRGLSKQDIKSLYAHQKGEPPAPAAATGPAKAWNEFQHEYAGTGLSRQQAAHLYHAQKQQPQEPVATAAVPARATQKKADPRSLLIPNPFASAFQFPVPSPMPSDPPKPNPTSLFGYHDARNQELYGGVMKAESQYPTQQMPFTFGYGPSGVSVATPTPNQGYQSPFALPTPSWITQAAGGTTSTTAAPSNDAAHRYYEAHETMVYLPFAVDSHGQDRSPEELAFKYYRQRQAKTKSVASVKAIFASAYAPREVKVQQVPKHIVQAPPPPPPPPPTSRETKQKMALSTVKEEDEEDNDESRIVSTAERGHTTRKGSFAKRSENPPTTEIASASAQSPVKEARDMNVEASVAAAVKAPNTDETDTKPKQPTEADESSSASLVFSASHEDRIAKGITGPILKATINGGSTQVAVKLVPGLNSKQARACLAKESAALMKLPAHPNVAKFHCVEPLEDGKTVGVVTELVSESENLVTRLYTGKIPTMCEATKQQLILQLLDAINHLHTHGIPHRDLTPTHVLVSTNADDSVAVKLIDFGLPTLKNAAAVALTKAGVTGFNPAYASPELLGGQIARDDVDAWKKSDIYSFAVVMIEILLEDQPWEGELPVFFMKAVAERGERPFDVDGLLLHGRKSRVLERIVAQAWHQDPEKRPTASVLRDMLTKVFGIGDRDVHSPTSPKTSPEESAT